MEAKVRIGLSIAIAAYAAIAPRTATLEVSGV